MSDKDLTKTVDQELGLDPTPDDTQATDYTAIPEEDLAYLTPEERKAYEAAMGPSPDELAEQQRQQEEEARQREEQEAAERARQEAEAQAQLQEQAQKEAETEAEIARQLQELKAQRAKLYDDLTGGEIDDDEWRRLDEELVTQEIDLAAQKGKIDAGKEAREQALRAQQEAALQEFHEVATKFTEQHDYLKSPEHFEAFNKTLGDLSETEYGAQMSHEQLLAAALEEYRPKAAHAGHPLPDPDTTGGPAPDPAKDAGKDNKVPERRTDERKAPPTLAALPNEQLNPHTSEVAEIAARLEAAQGIERERIIAALPDNIADKVLQYAD